MTHNATENILLIAYGCEPGRGSEPGIGWAHAVETARHRPTWIITHPDHRAALDAGIAAWNGDPANCLMRADYVDVARPLRRLARAGYAGFNIYYYLWCLAAERAARAIDDQVGIDLVQHVSLTRWWMPSPGAALARRGARFIWGPLAAGETMPRRFRKGIGFHGHLTEWSRWVARSIFVLDPRLWRCARLADVALAEPRETARRLARLGAKRIDLAMSLPADLGRAATVAPMDKPAGVFRLVSGGGLVYWKCFDLAVRAFAAAFKDDPNAEYVHVCGGRELAKIRRLADELGVGERVKLPGEMPHAQSVRWVASADLYVLPTLRDTTGHLFEAMAAGVPALTTDHLSPGVIVDERCGAKVDVANCRTRDDLVRELAAVMRRWHDEFDLRRRLGEGARQRAAELSGERFGAAVRTVQSEMLGLGRRGEARLASPIQGNVAGSGARVATE